MSSFVDGQHPDAGIEEWVFAAWTADAQLGVISGHRLVGRTAWYWAALARAGRPLLHVTDFEVPVRKADPFIVKGEQLWAEHTMDAPMEQWSIGNETYAAALDDPEEALGRAYGVPTPIAFDLEWYAIAPPTALADLGGADDGYEQPGVAHGRIDIAGEPPVEFAETPAHRWHRWGAAGFGPVLYADVVAHTGVRAPFAFPDDSRSDLVLTPVGWCRRDRRRRPHP